MVTISDGFQDSLEPTALLKALEAKFDLLLFLR